MWDPQVAALSDSFRILRYDHRGHGQSSATPGPYTIETLARDVVALLDALKIARVHFCGLSLGGMVGMWLGASAPDRVEKLILANTSAQLGPPENWNSRITAVRQSGMQSISDAVLGRWFTPAFREAAPQSVSAIRQTLVSTPPEGYCSCCAAIRDMDLRSALPTIHAPTLVINGTHDPATPPAMGQQIAAAIPGAVVTELPAAHLSNIEAADGFNAALREFLLPKGSPLMDEHERHKKGMAVRRAVLGDAHVDKAIANSTPLTQEFQDFLTRYAWGEIWDRPGLPRHTRSLLTIAMMVALNRGDELRMHIRAAKNNGVTPEQIKEVLLHTAIYCGLPAANAAFHMLAEEFPAQGSDHR
jgi:3-oxoadipate enol-lactonase/4-carboxymuconolactone decarboxylase